MLYVQTNVGRSSADGLPEPTGAELIGFLFLMRFTEARMFPNRISEDSENETVDQQTVNSGAFRYSHDRSVNTLTFA